jgi:transcriptional regulator with XRE-family HTH domain
MNIKLIGKTIAERRRALNIDQKTLSEISGVAVHTLSDIESGKGNPTVRVLNSILDVLGMELVVRV